MVHRMDDRARTEEQHRLEEGVREKVEHRSGIHADAGGHEHVAKLRHSRIGDHALDIRLHEADRRGDEGSRGTQNSDEGHRFGREFHQGRHTADEEDTGCYHRRGVDEGRYGRRAFHRVGQPRVQEKLRRFPHGSHEKQESNEVRGIPVRPEEPDGCLGKIGDSGEDIVKANAVGQVKQPKNPQRKPEVTDPVHHERLDRRRIGRRFAIVETDQEVGGDANAFPAKEHLNEVVRCHQSQHGEGEERQIGEKPGAIALAFAEVVVMCHVAEGIEVHEAGNRSDHDQHDRGETVHPDRPIGAQRTALDETEQRNDLGFTVEREEHDPRKECGEKKQPGCRPLRRDLANGLPSEAADQSADERREKDDGFHDLSPSSR